MTQHPEFPALLDWLMQPERAHVRLSIASVRTNTVTPELARALAARGTRSLTVAVESGSARVRGIVNKKLGQEEIVEAARNAQAGGLEALKLYGMVGVPGEREEGERGGCFGWGGRAVMAALRAAAGVCVHATTCSVWCGLAGAHT